jgi:hypothetical protein
VLSLGHSEPNKGKYVPATVARQKSKIDDLGLVTAYPGGWERIASL